MKNQKKDLYGAQRRDWGMVKPVSQEHKTAKTYTRKQKHRKDWGEE